MPIYADAAFRIGRSHEVCQDYAAALISEVDDVVIAAISDGCSGAPDSDIGARALVHAILDIAKLIPALSEEQVRWLVLNSSSHAVSAMFRPRSALLGTLLALVRRPAGGWKGIVWGDGIVGRQMRGSREWWVDVIQSPVNEQGQEVPFYPSYLRNRDSQSADRASLPYADTDVEVATYRLSEGDNCAIKICGEMAPAISLSFEDLREGDDGCDACLIGSDGWASFVDRRSRSPIPIERVLGELLPFRSGGQGFVRRRVAAFLRSVEKMDWVHGDDLSLAAIVLGSDDNGDDRGRP